jgi:hypothetical protein
VLANLGVNSVNEVDQAANGRQRRWIPTADVPLLHSPSGNCCKTNRQISGFNAERWQGVEVGFLQKLGQLNNNIRPQHLELADRFTADSGYGAVAQQADGALAVDTKPLLAQMGSGGRLAAPGRESLEAEPSAQFLVVFPDKVQSLQKSLAH